MFDASFVTSEVVFQPLHSENLLPKQIDEQVAKLHLRAENKRLRHLSSTLTEQRNSEDAFLSIPIVHARMSALSLPTESVSPGA